MCCLLNTICGVIVIFLFTQSAGALWNTDVKCPLECNCRLEHLTETATYRHISKNSETRSTSFSTYIDNDVLYYDDVQGDNNTVMKTATCILLSETDPPDLLHQLPKDIESLTLMQGYDSGNKTVKFSDLELFPNLIIIVLKGAHSLNSNFSKLICEIDKELQIKYLDIEKVLIKGSKRHLISNDNELDKMTFEYVQNFEANAHPLTLVRKGLQEKILPYNQYKEQQENEQVPLFVDLKSLILLRISGCDLNQIHWRMFEGLRDLLFLILEDNNIKFIPDFAFYSVPNLKTLSLAKNHLLNLQITDLAGLLELEYLDLSHNNFSQLSELSLPPFPKLKLANFGNNPISVVFPNTFEVMNTTDSIILGSDDTLLSLLTNSFVGLNQLRKLTLNNLKMPILRRDIFTGIPNLKELILTGNIPELEFDSFLEVNLIEKLILKNCNIHTISMDALLGLFKLKVLDLSKNQLEYLTPGIFDDLINLHELYLNNNKFTTLPKEIFNTVHPKLLRLNNNPWHCSCDMSLWKPMIINRIKQRTFKPCDNTFDKGINCKTQTHIYKYIYDNRVAPKCSTPKKFLNWSIFHSMRKGLQCSEFKPKYKKYTKSTTKTIDTKKTRAKLEELSNKMLRVKQDNHKLEKLLESNRDKSVKITLFSNDRNKLLNHVNDDLDIDNKINNINYKNPSKIRTNNKILFDNNI